MTPKEQIRRALLVLEAAQTNSREAQEDKDDPLMDHAQLSVAVDMAANILKEPVDPPLIDVPAWLWDETITDAAKWTYLYLLKMRQELCGPGHNALAFPLEQTAKAIFPVYAWSDRHLRDALKALTEKKIIFARRLDYPADYPEH